jgi:hypothetical protein
MVLVVTIVVDSIISAKIVSTSTIDLEQPAGAGETKGEQPK